MEKGLDNEATVAVGKGSDALKTAVESASGAANGSSRERTENGHASQSGEARDRGGVKLESNRKQSLHVEEQELLDGWAKLSPSSESLSTFVRSLGVKGLRVDQWHNVDVPESTDGCVYGLVFLYKWRVDRGTGQKRGFTYGESSSDAESSGGDVNDVMFVNQFVNSGSASQGIVTALLNLPEDQNLSSNVTPGPKLTELLSFCRPLTPAVRAAAVCSSAAVHEAHNHAAMCHPSPSVRRNTLDASVSEDFWMYTVYSPGKSGRWVYELDGRAKERKLLGHVRSAEISHEDSLNNWVGVVTEALEKRVKELRQHRVPFQLHALVENVPCQSPLTRDIGKDEHTSTKNAADDDGRDGDACLTGKDGSVKKEMASSSSKCRESSGRESSGRESSGLSHEEHLVASHDYETFFIEMLKLLGSKGELIQLVADAARGPVMSKVQNMEEAFPNGVEETSIYDASSRVKMHEPNHATSSDE